MKIDGIDLDPGNLTQDLLQLLVGERWPNGDEGAMRSVASAWSQAAEQINEIRQTATAAAQQVQQYCQGENGESFQSFWSASFDDGKTSWPSGQAPAALPFAEVFCKSMSQALNSGANQIETTKDTIMGNIAILVATVAPQIAAGFFDFGATDATALAEIAADRTAMEIILDGAKELIAEVVEQAFEQGLQQAELNFLIQVKEVAEGHAASIDWKQVGSSGLSGAEGGALGAGFGFGLGKAGAAAFGEDFGKSFLGKAATGVVSGQLTNASLDLMQNGTISASDFTKGSLAGVLGGMGGADAAAKSATEIHLDTPAIDEPTAAGDHAATLDIPAATDLSGIDLGQTDLHTEATVDTGIGDNGVDPGATQSSVSAGADVTGMTSIARILGGETRAERRAAARRPAVTRDPPAAATVPPRPRSRHRPRAATTPRPRPRRRTEASQPPAMLRRRAAPSRAESRWTRRDRLRILRRPFRARRPRSTQVPAPRSTPRPRHPRPARPRRDSTAPRAWRAQAATYTPTRRRDASRRRTRPLPSRARVDSRRAPDSGTPVARAAWSTAAGRAARSVTGPPSRNPPANSAVRPVRIRAGSTGRATVRACRRRGRMRTAEPARRAGPPSTRIRRGSSRPPRIRFARGI